MGLTDLFDGLAEVAKLTIEAYADADFETPLDRVFTVMYNPTTYSQNYKSVWVRQAPTGGTAETQTFTGIKSDSVSFEFLFDGTGVSGVGGTAVELNPDMGEIGYVQEQIDAFMDITHNMNSDTHEPNFLVLSWGEFIFQGVMENATINHKLFHSSGVPLRSTINATFIESVTRSQQAAQARRSSPDLTHYRIVKNGENLPLIAKKIYGDPSLYLELARVNGINNIRKLKAGQKLVLPPINKKENV